MDPEAEPGPVNIKKKLWRKRRKLVLVELMQDFANNTTLHGPKYIAERGLSTLERLFWIATFLISISMCAFLIHNVWVKWETSPVLVALSEHLVPVGEVPFPSVTICPEIKAQRTVYNFSQETMKIFHATRKDVNFSSEETQNINKYEDVGLICWIEHIYTYPSRNYSDSQVIEHIAEVSPNVSQVFRGCVWRQVLMDCEELFQPVYTTEGLCFVMNSLAANEIFREENVQQGYPYLNTSTPAKGWSHTSGYSNEDEDVYPRRGRGNGGTPDLKIILREKIADRDGLCNGISRGFKIFLQHPADMPQASLYYYAALPKQTSSFALKFSVLNTSNSLRSYPAETRQCYFPEERELRYFLTYTASNCRLECLSNYTFEHCGCVWYHMPHSDSLSICREKKRSCVEKALEKYAAEEGQSNNNITRCQCLPSCVAIQYDAEILKTKFAANSYLQGVKNVFPEWFASDNSTDEDEGYELSQIDMYYKEPRYVSMRRSELFGLTDFLANCGGLLGLFLGFSFLSLVEIAYFCTLRFRKYRMTPKS